MTTSQQAGGRVPGQVPDQGGGKAGSAGQAAMPAPAAAPRPDPAIRRHLEEMLARLRPLLEMADHAGVPGLAAARLRTAAMEIEEALSPGAMARHSAQDNALDRENMDLIHERERERGAWGFDEA